MRVFTSKIDIWLGLVILLSVFFSLAVSLGMAFIMNTAGMLFSVMVLALGVILPM